MNRERIRLFGGFFDELVVKSNFFGVIYLHIKTIRPAHGFPKPFVLNKIMPPFGNLASSGKRFRVIYKAKDMQCYLRREFRKEVTSEHGGNSLRDE